MILNTPLPFTFTIDSLPNLTYDFTDSSKFEIKSLFLAMELLQPLYEIHTQIEVLWATR